MQRLDLVLPLRQNHEDIFATARQHAPTLAMLPRLGQRSPAEASLAACLCEHFGIARQRDWPVAPIRALADGLDSGSGHWLCIDPVHLAVGMGGLILHGAEAVGLRLDEAEALAASVRPIWAKHGIDLLTPKATHWYLRLPEPADLLTTPIDLLGGAYLTSCLPTGTDARRLMRLVNEAQMRLHGHPVNQNREALGQASINGLWLWGGGHRPRLGETPGLIAGQQPLCHAMAGYAGIEAIACPDGFGEACLQCHAAHTLVILPEPAPYQAVGEHLAALERNWLAPMLRALRFGRLRQAGFHLLAEPAWRLELGFLASWGCKPRTRLPGSGRTHKHGY